QLALEDKKLNEKLTEYETPLADILKDEKDIIGVVAVINGEVSGADAFCSADLFRKLWPKLVKSACTEALAEFKTDKKFEPVKAEHVEAFLVEAAKGKGTELAADGGAGRGQQTLNLSNDALRQTDGQVQRRDSNDITTAAQPAQANSAKVRVLKFTN